MMGTRALVENIAPAEPNCGQMAYVDLIYLLFTVGMGNVLFMDCSHTSLDSGKWVWSFPVVNKHCSKIEIFKFSDHNDGEADDFDRFFLFHTYLSGPEVLFQDLCRDEIRG